MNKPAATLLLVRHGQARAPDGSYGRETPLSDLGRRQADAVAVELAAGEPLAAVYTSPFPRAVQTAIPLSERLDLEPVLDKRLAEFELGTAPLDPSAFDRERPDLFIWHPTHTAVEDGENLSEFSARVGDFCHEVAEMHVGERVAIVAHSGTIEAAIRWSLSIAPDELWQSEFDIGNGSITEVEYWPRGRVEGGAPCYAALKRIGDVSHLGGLATDI